MKVVVLALLAAVAACKPDPVAKPAEGSAAAVTPAPAPAARPHAPPPALPAEQEDSAGSDEVPIPMEDKHARADLDGDGIVTPEERATRRAERMKRFHDRFDTNHDGKVSPDELSGAGNGSGRRGPHFDDAAALDTDHNGDISADELQEGMRQLRQKRRAERAGSAE